MSLEGPCGEGKPQAAVPAWKAHTVLQEEVDVLCSRELAVAEIESISNQSICNPIRTPSCNTSVVGGSSRPSSSRRRSNHHALACIAASTASAAFVITPPTCTTNSSTTQLTARSVDGRATPKIYNKQAGTTSTRSRPVTPKYGDAIITSRPVTPKTPRSPTRQSPRLIAASTPDTFHRKTSFSRHHRHHHHHHNHSSTSSTDTSLTTQVNRLLFSQAPTPSSSSRCSNRCSRLCPNPLSSTTSTSRDPRLPPLHPHHHQVEPYARSRKSDPQGYLFTCYLDYNRFVKPPPPSFTEVFVRPESLQYAYFTHSTCPSTCETPRSSTSTTSSSTFSLTSRRLYNSRPATPAPPTRVKEVHRITMTGVPIDVKELSNCYLFVAEIPGLKNTDVKVQVENDSILKISGDRKREECDECEVKYIRVERQVGRFTRKFNLPVNADVERISAACQDGLLSVVVPKNPPLEQRRPKNFEVKIAT